MWQWRVGSETTAMTDPLRDPAPLVRRVYAYAAYRLGEGPAAEDVTSETFERALRYRGSYDPSKGPPTAWLVGIARRVVEDTLQSRAAEVLASEPDLYATTEQRAFTDPADAAGMRLDLAAAVARLSPRDRELIALRYGSDLRSREIGKLLDMKVNAVEVALHRALDRLRALIEDPEASGRAPGKAAEAGGLAGPDAGTVPH
jgi:RNA polymerase sigma-70 factor (ECF subfamily)